MARIDIPTGTMEMVDLARSFHHKHVADGASSPLLLFNEVDWNQLGGTLDEVIARHKKAEELTRQAEQLYKERDQLLKPIEEGLKKSRNFLKTLYPSNPKKLGEWGLDVVS